MSVFIGIDPGTHTGFAVWDSTYQQLLEVSTYPLWRAMEQVQNWKHLCEADGVSICVIYEDARTRRWFPKDKSESEYRGHLMGAGAAKRDSVIWQEFLTAKGIPCEPHAPRAGMTKWDKSYWYKMTGWEGRTSHHGRDAALMVWGR